MKDRLIQLIANMMISVSKHYEGNVSPRGYYKPRKIKWIDDIEWVIENKWKLLIMMKIVCNVKNRGG